MKCLTENESDDTQRTKLNVSGMLYTGQRDSQRDLDLTKENIMGIMKQQLETLCQRVNGSITITDELMTIVSNHNIRQDTDVCWCWTDENGKDTCGGIGALANFINNDCKTIRWVGQRNHVRVAINGSPVWTTSNGG